MKNLTIDQSVLRDLYCLFTSVFLHDVELHEGNTRAGYQSIFFDTIFVSIQNDKYSIYHLVFSLILNLPLIPWFGNDNNIKVCHKVRVMSHSLHLKCLIQPTRAWYKTCSHLPPEAEVQIINVPLINGLQNEISKHNADISLDAF